MAPIADIQNIRIVYDCGTHHNFDPISLESFLIFNIKHLDNEAFNKIRLKYICDVCNANQTLRLVSHVYKIFDIKYFMIEYLKLKFLLR